MSRRISLIVLIAFAFVMAGCKTTSIHQAVRNNKFNHVKQLVEENPAVVNEREEGKERGGAATRQGHVGWTPLHWAANRKNNKIARYLIDNGADVNAAAANGWTPLDEAMKVGALKIEAMIREAAKQ